MVFFIILFTMQSFYQPFYWYQKLNPSILVKTNWKICWADFTFNRLGICFTFSEPVACRKINLLVINQVKIQIWLALQFSENSTVYFANGMSKRGLKSNFHWWIPLFHNWYKRLTRFDCRGALYVRAITNTRLFQFRHWTSKPNNVVALFSKALLTLKLLLSAAKEY